MTTDPMANPGRGAAVDALTNERFIHRFANFPISTDSPACGLPEPQISALETQAIHSPDGGFPQGLFRFCERVGGP